MMLAIATLVLLMQAAPGAQQPAAKASIAGVVVQSVTGEPIPNVRVSLARTDAALGGFAEMAAGDHPPTEISIPGELLAVMKEEIAQQARLGAADPEAAREAAAFGALPADDIEELIASPDGTVAVVYKSSPPAITDARGRFIFDNVEPGTYKLIFSAGGYAKQDYGQRTIGGAGTPIALGPGQAKRDVVMRMARVSAISGRIRESGGQPLAGVPVQLLRSAYNETGQRKMTRVASAQTNDRGDYRFYFVSPGRYYVSAGNLSGQNLRDNVGGPNPFQPATYLSPNRIAQNYTLTYYPGATDERSATPIDVPSGGELTGIDLFLSTQQTYRVRGRVVDSRTGQPPPAANIQPLRPQTMESTDVFSMMDFSNVPNYRPADGTFEVRSVAAGTYTLSVTLPNPNPPRPADLSSMSPAERDAYVQTMSAASLAAPKASTIVNVVNADVENVLLTVGVSGSISGRVRFDADPSPAPPRFDFVRISLRSPEAGNVNTDNAPQAGSPKPDGTFRMNNLWSGEYQLRVAGLPSGFYLKQARFGNADVLNGPLRYAGDDSNTLDIVISPNAGKIDGVVTDARGEPVPGVQVVLIPDRRDRAELFKTVTSDVKGHFAISGVTPGDYKLAAWDGIEPFAFFDPDLMRQADQNGKPVRIAESSQQTVNITAIPAAGR